LSRPEDLPGGAVSPLRRRRNSGIFLSILTLLPVLVFAGARRHIGQPAAAPGQKHHPLYR